MKTPKYGRTWVTKRGEAEWKMWVIPAGVVLWHCRQWALKASGELIGNVIVRQIRLKP